MQTTQDKSELDRAADKQNKKRGSALSDVEDLKKELQRANERYKAALADKVRYY